MLSEEEIIKILKNYNENKKEMMKETLCNAIQGLLDLYNKEKEDVIKQYELGLTQGAYEKNLVWEDKIREKIDSKFREAKGLYERGVQPQAQYTMKLLRDLEEELLGKEE